MPDEYQYFDESGKRIDPSDLDGIDYEIVHDPTTSPPMSSQIPHQSGPAFGSERVPPAPEPTVRIPKGLIVGMLILLLVGGGAAFGLSRIGDKNAVEDVKATASAAIETKQRRATEKLRPELRACKSADIKKAAWARGDDSPIAQLRTVGSLSLPPTFTERTTLSTNPTRETQILQYGDRSLGIYHHDRDARRGEAEFWKATATTTPELAVTGEGEGSGDDTDAATACPSVSGGVYRVVGDGIPDASREMQADLVQVNAIKGDGVEKTTVWIVAGDRLLKTTLEYSTANQ